MLELTLTPLMSVEVLTAIFNSYKVMLREMITKSGNLHTFAYFETLFLKINNKIIASL